MLVYEIIFPIVYYLKWKTLLNISLFIDFAIFWASKEKNPSDTMFKIRNGILNIINVKSIGVADGSCFRLKIVHVKTYALIFKIFFYRNVGKCEQIAFNENESSM